MNVQEARAEVARELLDAYDDGSFGEPVIVLTARAARTLLAATSPIEPAKFEPCATPGCPGDSRYAAPGRGHLSGCRYPMDLAHQLTKPDSREAD